MKADIFILLFIFIKMNSDSFWDNPMVRENKNLIMFVISLLIFVGTVYWFLSKQHREATTTTNTTATNNTNIPQQILQHSSSKRRLTINITDITDIKNPDMNKLKELFENLSQIYDLFMIILVDDNEDTMKFLGKYEPLYDTKLIYKHVNIILTLAYTILVKAGRHQCDGT
jgi:hypothetical protein